MIAAAALLLAALSPARASFDSSAAGTSAGEFLKLGVGARASAMGEAAVAVVDDAAAIHYNPAALTEVRSGAVSLMHAPYLADTFYDYAGLVRRLSPAEALGVAVEYFGAGSVDRTDAVGRSLGSAEPSDLALTLAYAHGLADGGSLGLSVKYIQSTIVDSAHTFAFGAGFLSRPWLDDKVRAALAVDNLAGQLKFDRESDPLPVLARLGTRLSLIPNVVAGLDAVLARDAPPALAAGAELDLGAIALRAGLNTSTLSQVGGLAGVSAGLGLRRAGWSFDYALVPFGSLGLSHRLSLSVKY